MKLKPLMGIFIIIICLLLIPAYKTDAATIKAIFSIGSAIYDVNGTLKLMDVTPFIKNNRTYVPVRYLAYAVGVPESGVTWDGDRTVTLIKGIVTVNIFVGDPTIIINGQQSKMDVMPMVVNNRTFLPARFIAEAFGYTVSWNEISQTILLDSVEEILPTPSARSTGSENSVTYNWTYKYRSYTWGPITYSTEMKDYFKKKPHPHLTMTKDGSGNNFQYYIDTYTQDSDNNLAVQSLAKALKDAAIKNGFEDQLVPFIISFVQDLPYISDSASTGFDEYGKYPLETLYDKGGDCEDTTFLVATLLRELDYGCAVLIFLDDADQTSHVAIGVLSEGLSGSHYEKDGNKYYYLETTQAGWKIGKIPDQLKDAKAHVIPVN